MTTFDKKYGLSKKEKVLRILWYIIAFPAFLILLAIWSMGFIYSDFDFDEWRDLLDNKLSILIVYAVGIPLCLFLLWMWGRYRF